MAEDLVRRDMAAAFRMRRAGPADSAAEAHHLELATSLVVRDSTAPPATRR